ncbi:saccharopine dehydrogenase, partial [Streptomyces sp. NPDC005046]
EAVDRILTGRTRTVGVASAGEIFDAVDFLRARPYSPAPAAPPAQRRADR